MRNVFIILSLFLCVLQQLQAQEDGVVSYRLPVRNSLKFNRYLINPAFSFVREQSSYISFYTKKQWVQFDDAPQTYLFGYSGRIAENQGAAIGLFQQNYGVLSTFGGVVNFAHNVMLQEDNNLTFGLNLGFYKSGINKGRVITNYDDPSLNNIPNNSLISINPGINYGTAFLDFGVSVNNLVLYNLKTSKIVQDDPERSIEAHIMHTGYLDTYGFFDKSKFSALIKTDLKKDKTEVSGLVLFAVPSGIWAQAGYNSVYGMSAGLGVNISPKISIEYNFEKGTGNLSNFGASHEIVFAYKFNKKTFYYNDEDEQGSIIPPAQKKKYVAAKQKDSPLLSPKDAQRLRELKEALKLEQQEKRQQQLAEAKQKAKADSIAQAKRIADARAQSVALTEAKKAADAKAKTDALIKSKQTAEAKAKAEALAKARQAAEEKAKAYALARAKKAAENRARIDSIIRAKLNAEEKTKNEALAKTKSEAENKAKTETLAVQKAKAAALAKAKLDAENKAKADALAKAKLDAENKAKADALAAQKAAEEKAKADTLAKAKLDAENKAKAEALAAQKAAEEKAKADALAKAKLDAENKAKADALAAQTAATPNDTNAKEMEDLAKSIEELKRSQQELLKKFNDMVAIKEKDLKDLKEENDLSEKGIFRAPKPFKSASAENRTIESLRQQIADINQKQNQKIKELEALSAERNKKASTKNDAFNRMYQSTISQLKTEQSNAVQTNLNLIASLEKINTETEIEKKRRIKRASFENDQAKYDKDRAVLNEIKEKTPFSAVPLKAEDFDFGEEQSNLQILKNVNHAENGYYLILAAHSDISKRNQFLTKTVAAGQSNIDFFYDVNTSKYFIYYEKFDDLEAAKRALKAKGSKPYNGKLFIVRIENN